MTWRFVPMKNNDYIAVYEYYDLPDGPCWTQDPIHPYGETKEELIEMLEMMLADVKASDVLDYNVKEEE